MPWSIPIAESVGAAAGFMAGEYAHLFARKIAVRFQLDQRQARFIATAAGHFIAAVTSKIVINVTCGNPIGLGISPFSSATTAFVHGSCRVIVDDLQKADTKPPEIEYSVYPAGAKG